ncbi:MAG: GGDEF domain-containing protein [Curvibacter sp.]|nr:GGDEF domain-containing protein [Curvibacter sp.]
MTAIRDSELLEQGLLKTLGSVLGVSDLSMYKTAPGGECIQAIHQHRKLTIDKQGVERVTERIDRIYHRVEMPANVQALITNVRLTGKPSTWDGPNGCLMVYPLAMIEPISGYLTFTLSHTITDTENAVVNGILQVYVNYFALLDESQRDRLTGLYNRHALELNMDRMWPLLQQGHQEASGKGRRQPPPQSCWLAIIDIDHFKLVNDRYGHVLGDEVLLLVSRLIGTSIRKNDLLYRYGGEEFLAITSAATADEALEQFERVRQKTADHLFPQIGQLTLSIGFTLIDPHFSAQEIISRADRALYQAKRDGRNRVHDFGALQRAGVLQLPDYGETELF